MKIVKYCLVVKRCKIMIFIKNYLMNFIFIYKLIMK